MVIVTTISSGTLFFVPPSNTGKIMFMILFLTNSIVTGIAQPGIGTLAPVAIDYGEWKFEKNSGGLIGSLGGCVQTLSNAFAGGVTAWILVLVNYVPNTLQTPTALTGIKFMMSLLPAILCLTGFIILKWDLSDERHKEIVKMLNERRTKAVEDISNT